MKTMRSNRSGAHLREITPRAEKKIREARYFLNHLRSAEKPVVSEAEEFDFLLSALLSAAHSALDLLKKTQRGRTKNFCKAWYDGLSDNDRAMADFMQFERGESVHSLGTRDRRETLMLPISRLPPSSAHYGFRSFQPVGTPEATVGVVQHFYTIAGSENLAVDVCARYVELLSELLRAAADATEKA